MASHFDLTGQGDSSSAYTALPGTSGDSFVHQNMTPNKAALSSGREVAGCHPSRWIYEVTNNDFSVCDLFDRARRANIDSPYAWDHQHNLVINGNQSSSDTSSEILSAVCLDCHFHFVFKMTWQEEHAASLCHHNQSGWPPRDNMFPWHHLVWVGSDSDANITRDSCKYNPIQARETFICSAPPCTFELMLEISEPRMPKWWIKLLLDHEAIREQLDIAKTQDPARYEGATDDWAYQAPLNLNTYLKNQLESTAETARSISKRNKRFCVLFGPRCFAIFRQLEFDEKEVDNDGVDEGSFTPVAAAPADGPNGTTKMNTYRAYLEDVRAEVQCLIHKAGQVTERPTYIAPALHAILRCTEVKDIASHSHVNAERYQILGVLPTQGREIVVNAYKRQWDLMPSRRKNLVEALLAVANDSQDDLLIDYAITQSSVFDSQPQQQAPGNDSETISQSLTFLGLSPPNHYSAEAIIQAFRTKIVQEPAEASTARSVLMWIASESQDDHYQAKLLMEADQKMSLDTAKALLGLQDADSLINDAPSATRKRLQETGKPEAKKVYLEALDSIAEHTGSLSLKHSAVELSNESSSAGSGALSSSNANVPVNFSLPVGLDNIGNTCYLNSLLQYLFTVRPIRDVVFNYDDLKLGLNDADIEQRRIGGNKMQMDRGEAVVADAFARELSTLFENLEESDKAAARPSQRLANAVLLSTRTLLSSSKAQQESQTGPKPPPLPSRPPPTADKAETEDIEMISVGSNNVPELDATSVSSTRTLVDQEEMGSDPSYEKVEHVPIEGDQPEVLTSEIRQVGDAEMADGNIATEATSVPVESVQEVAQEPEAEKTADVHMTDAEEAETVDQKVLNALEHQKRSSGTDQQDVEEVMGSIINRLQAAIRPSSVDEKTGIQLEKLMETFFVTTVNYTKKFHEKNYQHEISFDRSITAYPAEEGPCSLYDALGRNFDQQILEESKLSRYTAIKTLPPVLHVLIQRTTSKGSKNGNPVVIPETLYLDRYMDMNHDSPAFQRRVEDWITAKRIADIKTQLAKVEPNPTYMRSLESYSSAIPEPPDIPEAPGSVGEDDAISIEVETWDFDGPVEDDFLLVSPKTTESSQPARELPKVEGIYETHLHIKEMMEEELKQRELAIQEHNEALSQIPYRLHAVICHRGQLMSGHYWVWIHDFEENVWRWYNDADVKENKNTAEVLQTLSTSGEPYFLCYVRDDDKNDFVNVPKRKQPPTPEPEPEAEQDSRPAEMVEQQPQAEKVAEPEATIASQPEAPERSATNDKPEARSADVAERQTSTKANSVSTDDIIEL